MAKHIEVSYSCDVCGVTDAPNPDSHEQDPWPKNWVEMTMRQESGRATTNLICTGCVSAVAEALRPQYDAKLVLDK